MSQGVKWQNVYLVDSAGMPRDHLAIVVETDLPTAGAGFSFQVSGSIQQGTFFKPPNQPSSKRR